MSDNDHVKADSLLVQIDPSEYKVRLAQAEADLAAARATAGGAGSNGQAQAMVEQATGQRASLDAQIAAAQANEMKATAGSRAHGGAGGEADRLEAAARRRAGGGRGRVGERRRAAAADDGGRRHDRRAPRPACVSPQARLQGAQAARDNAALQLSYTRVAAPAAGIVSRKQVEPGQLVQAGQPLLTIVTDTGVFVTANFKETQLADIRVGQPVEIDVDAYGGAKAHRVRRERERGDGSEVRAAPARQRDRQLHESRAARSGAHSREAGPRRGSAAAAGHVGDGARRHEGSRRKRASQTLDASANATDPASSSSHVTERTAGHGAYADRTRRPAATPREDKYKYKYLIAIAVTLAAVLELIDTSIVNVAIPHMMGNLGATLDEISWVSTGYIIANVIVIPMSGWLSAYFGRKRYLTGSIMLFVRRVVLLRCGDVARRPRSSGASCRASAAARCCRPRRRRCSRRFRRRKSASARRCSASASWSVRRIGPTLGGWIVDNYNWPWIFYINVPLGIIAAIMVCTYVHDAEHQERAETIDVLGFLLLATCVGSLQFMLEKGERYDWFDSRLVTGLGDHVGRVVRAAHLARADDRRADHQLPRARRAGSSRPA